MIGMPGDRVIALRAQHGCRRFSTRRSATRRLAHAHLEGRGSHLPVFLVPGGARLNRVEENGALLNRPRRGKLASASLLARSLATRPVPEGASERHIRDRAGAVQEAVFKVLASSDQPMRARDIHSAAQRLAGASLSENTVRDCLHTNARRPTSRVERVGWGRYRYRRALGGE